MSQCQIPSLFSSRFCSEQLDADSESTLNTGDIYEREAQMIIDYSILTADVQVGPPQPQPPSEQRNQRVQINNTKIIQVSMSLIVI